MSILCQIIPQSWPLFAIFADADGMPYAQPIVCLGMFEARPEHRVVVGYTAAGPEIEGDMGEHLQMADAQLNLIGYSVSPTDLSRWEAKAKAKRGWLIEKDANEAQAKIVIPGRDAKGKIVLDGKTLQ